MEVKPESTAIEMADIEQAKNEQFLPSTAAEEAAVLRKLDFRVMPLIIGFYTLSVLDRSNLGNAKLAGLPNSIDLTGNNYALLATVFYIAYILSQWTAAGYKAFKPHRFIACVIFFIGLFSTMQAAVTNWAGMAALRVLLGVVEAMYAGVPVYLSFFYARDQLGLRIGLYLTGAALANAYGGALGYAIGSISNPAIAPWRVLFIIEGVPSCLAAGLAWWLLPDNIATAKFLTPRDKEVQLAMVGRDQVVGTEEGTGVSWRQYLSVFTDYKCFIPGLMYFGINVSYASLPLFVPTILAEIGSFNTQEANGLSAPPYLLVVFTIIAFAWYSDKWRVRGAFVVVGAVLAAIGFLLLATTTTAAPRYLGIFLAVNIFASVSILVPWIQNSHETESRRAGGWGLAATMGQCGPLLGTNIFPASEGPYYVKGSIISCCFSLMVAILAVIYSLLLRRENRKLDKVWAEELERSGSNSTEKGFRYMV